VCVGFARREKNIGKNINVKTRELAESARHSSRTKGHDVIDQLTVKENIIKL